MYKEAYKEKLRKEKEEREKDDVQTKKEANKQSTYGRNTTSYTTNTKTTVSTTASSNNGQVSNQNKDINNKKPIGSNLNNNAMKTQDNMKKDEIVDKQGIKKNNFEDINVKNKVVTGNKNNSNLKRDSANTNNQNSIPGSSKQTSSYPNGGRSAMSNGRTLPTKTAQGVSPINKVNDIVSGQSIQNDGESLDDE